MCIFSRLFSLLKVVAVQNAFYYFTEVCTRDCCYAGMFIIVGTLLVLQEVSKTTAERVQAFFNPALNWIQRWLPLFYVPTLVVLPVAVQGIQGVLSVACFSGLL